MNDTKERILDVAERLFAEQGFANTSLRHIITEAGVNLAAVHYHFGSKDELLDELIRRRVDPVNRARIETLDRLEAEAGGKPLEVEAILRAFLEPGVKAALEHPSLIRLTGRLHAEGLAHDVLHRHFEAMARRYMAAAKRTLPDLQEDELVLRFHYLGGSIAASVVHESFPVEAARMRRLVATLIAFLKGGLMAPPAPLETEFKDSVGEKIEVEI
jgi:AcrR family transcriptional regulator